MLPLLPGRICSGPGILLCRFRLTLGIGAALVLAGHQLLPAHSDIRLEWLLPSLSRCHCPVALSIGVDAKPELCRSEVS